MFPNKDANVENMGPSGSQITNIDRGLMQVLLNGTYYYTKIQEQRETYDSAEETRHIYGPRTNSFALPVFCCLMSPPDCAVFSFFLSL